MKYLILILPLMVMQLLSNQSIAQINDAEENNKPRQRVVVQPTKSVFKLAPDAISAPNFNVFVAEEPARELNTKANRILVFGDQKATLRKGDQVIRIGMALPKGQSINHLNGKNLALKWNNGEQKFNRAHKRLLLTNENKIEELVYVQETQKEPHTIKLVEEIRLEQQKMNTQKGIQIAPIIVSVENSTEKIKIGAWQSVKTSKSTYWIYVSRSAFYPTSELDGGCATSGYTLKALIIRKQARS